MYMCMSRCIYIRYMFVMCVYTHIYVCAYTHICVRGGPAPF